MKRFLLITAALAAAVVVFVLVSLPPTPLSLDTSWSDGTVPGVLHVHTNRSDGLSPPEEVAAAVARAGLRFVVFTDHGDATRAPDPPVYRSGVLCLDGVEISTNGGHYIAIDMPRSPYPLGGDVRDVVEDVHRLGGFGIAAHPDSPKPALQWRGWDAPFDAIELINPDTSWRVRAAERGWRPKFSLLRALTTYPVRGAETIATLLTNSPATLARWEGLTRARRVVAVAGVDAHAKLELWDGDSGDNRIALPVPSYDASFRVLSVRVRPEQPLTGDAAGDAARVIAALRSGRAYTVVDGWATPPAFEFTARNRSGSAREGQELPVDGPVVLRVRSNAPPGFLTTVWQGAKEMAASSEGREFEWTVPETPSAYRVEIRTPDRPDGPPWITSNPIYLRDPTAPATVVRARPNATRATPLFDGRTTAGWSTEADQASLAALEVAQRLEGSELRLRYGLSGAPDTGQFAGAAVETPKGAAPHDRISFIVRAEHPMRLSVQLRANMAGGEPQRWQRSIYVEPNDRDRTIFFDDMTPVGETHSSAAPLVDVRSVMIVIDTTNTKPGSSGRVWLRDVRLER
jgi:hypothetical protein